MSKINRTQQIKPKKQNTKKGIEAEEKNSASVKKRENIGGLYYGKRT